MAKNFLCVIITVCFVITASSCATIISGRTQNLPVVSIPTGAIATVGGMKQMTPATFTLDRRMSVYQITVEKEGYEPVVITLKRGLNGWVFGNIIFGGIIGLIVDIANGSSGKFTPDEVEVNLIKKQLSLNNLKGKDILLVKLKGE